MFGLTGTPFRQSLVPLLWSRSGRPGMAASTRSARPHAAVLMYLGLASLPLGTAAATEVDCYSGNGATYNGTRSRTATGAGAAQTTPAHSSMPAVHAMRLARQSVETDSAGARAAAGTECTAWALNKPLAAAHTLGRLPSERSAPSLSSLPSNYCRNPNGDSQPWCFTADGWDYCDVPRCPIARGIHRRQPFEQQSSPLRGARAAPSWPAASERPADVCCR